MIRSRLIQLIIHNFLLPTELFITIKDYIWQTIERQNIINIQKQINSIIIQYQRDLYQHCSTFIFGAYFRNEIMFYSVFCIKCGEYYKYTRRTNALCKC